MRFQYCDHITSISIFIYLFISTDTSTKKRSCINLKKKNKTQTHSPNRNLLIENKFFILLSDYRLEFVERKKVLDKVHRIDNQFHSDASTDAVAKAHI